MVELWGDPGSGMSTRFAVSSQPADSRPEHCAQTFICRMRGRDKITTQALPATTQSILREKIASQDTKTVVSDHDARFSRGVIAAHWVRKY